MTRGLARTSAGRPLGEDLAVVEDRDAVADPHHDAHVVLDEQDREPELGSQAADERGQLAGLAGVHAGGRLVEQEQLRTGRERTSDLEATLVAVREVPCPGVRPCPQADELQQFVPALDRRLLFGMVARRAQDRVPPATAEVRVLSHEDVVERGHRPEQPDVLEGPADPELGHLVRPHRLHLAAARRDDRVAIEGDLARGRHVGARDHVEERRLARAVGADQRDDRAPAGCRSRRH